MNIPERAWKIATILFAMLSAFVAVLIVKELKSIAYVGADVPVTNTIAVSGTGDAVAVPDVATFSFGVSETAKTVSDAQTAATNKINAALKAVRDAGVADKDIQTTSYNINPHYDYQNNICTVNSCPPSHSVLTGYDVSQEVQVKVRDLTKAGSIFTSIGSLGLQNIGNLAFSVDKPETIQAQARSKAIDNAKAKADTMAKELGVTLVRIISFSEDTGGNPRPIMYAVGMADSAVKSAPVPELPAGQEKVTDNVTITYEIR